MAKKSKKVMVLQWETDGCAEYPIWYRVDEIKEGSRFFQHLLDNAETDGREKFTVIAVTEKQWQKAVKEGEEAA